MRAWFVSGCVGVFFGLCAGVCAATDAEGVTVTVGVRSAENVHPLNVPFVESQLQRSADAQARLDVFRLRQGELPRIISRLNQQIEDIARRHGADTDVALMQLREQRDALADRIQTGEQILNERDPESFTQYREFVARDRMTRILNDMREVLARLDLNIRKRLRDLASRDPEGRELVREVWDADIELPRVSSQRWSAQRQRDNITRSAGGAVNSYRPEESPPADMATLTYTVPPPHDASERMARFRSRNAPHAIQSLSERFFSQIVLDHPGLEDVAAHYRAGRHQEALDAYKHYFFASVSDLQVMFDGILLEDQHDDEADLDGEAMESMAPPPAAVRAPHPKAIESAMNGEFTYTLLLGQPPRRVHTRVTLNPGQPGQINWALPEYADDEDDAMRQAFDLYAQQINGPGILGGGLRNSYVLTGNRAHLQRWMDLCDDWAMNWGRDIDNAPSMIRPYNMLVGYTHNNMVRALRNSAVLRPGFVDDFSSATLARMLLAANAEYTASAIRLMRSGIYNFRIMMLNGMIPQSLAFQEFHTQRWAAREATRLAELNWVHKIRRDGANAELANAGHENTDGSLWPTVQHLIAANPDWLTPFWAEEFRQNVAQNARYWVHFMNQSGRAYRISTSPLNGHFAPGGSVYVNLLSDDPEVRARLWRVFGIPLPHNDLAAQAPIWEAVAKGEPEPEPTVRSESMAFAGYYMLRNGWHRTNTFFYMHGINQPVSSGRDDHNAILLQAHNVDIFSAPPVYVDGRIQYWGYDLQFWPGGKANYVVQAKENKVKETRFHTSDAFDLAESAYDGPYVYHPEHRRDTFANMFGTHPGYNRRAVNQLIRLLGREGKELDETPIRDVRHTRLVLAVNEYDMYIVTDFMESPEPRSYDQFYNIHTPVRPDHNALRMELLKKEGFSPVHVDQASRTVRVRNPGYSALDMMLFANVDVLVQAEDPYEQHIRQNKAPADAPIPYNQRTSIHWQAEGDSVLTTVMAHYGPHFENEPESLFSNVRALEGAPGFSGFTARLKDGTPVYYVASQQPMRMGAGQLFAEARVFLRVGNKGIILDATRVEANGNQVDLAHADFEFELTGGAFEVTRPIYRPIDPVRIEPEQTVFVQPLPVTLSCPTPGVEIRYTVDGSEPQHDSPLYTGPVTLTDTTWLKARAFRPGMTETPWGQDGTHATVSSWGIFEKVNYQPAVAAPDTPNGMSYEYFQDIWPVMLAESPTYPASKTGVVPTVLDVSPRENDQPFGMRYKGYIEVSRDGVYTFHAPQEFMYLDIEAAYDLRLYVNGEEWYPTSRWHAHGAWSVALQQGKHEFEVAYVDMRRTPHRIEMQWDFPHQTFTWQGVAPDVQIEGPGLPRQTIPAAMLYQSK